MKDFLSDLNKVQYEAVSYVDGPSLVIAGAGSGKTRVLTYKIAHLLNIGIKAHSILALTFTNKAAKEMKERISKMIGQDKARNLWMGTFHSIFARILREEGHHLGFPSTFTIYDTQDSKSLVKSILKELKIDEKAYPVGDVYHRISMAKNNLVTPAMYESNAEAMAQDKANKRPLISLIFKMYYNKCKLAKSMDFDDLLLNTNILFRDHPEVLAKYQQRFQWILVDEYQDTNFSQYLIVKKLADRHKKVCVVGDDAQSIYAFRGAKIENILNFQRDYPGNRLFKLEQNYRSTQTIVNAANSVIAKNEKQLRKEVFSEKEIGTKIKVLEAVNEQDEGYQVTNAIIEKRVSEDFEFKDFAILYRTNAQSRIFEECLRKRSIPYKIYGGLSFYQRKEIKDLIAYFRLCVNHDDNEALKRIINYPKRGIGDTTIEKLEEFATAKNVSLWSVIHHITQLPLGLNAGTTNKIIQFATMIDSFTASLNTQNAFELATNIVQTTGIKNELFADKSIEGIGRYENVEELLTGIKEFSEQKDIEPTELSLDKYLEDVALLTGDESDKEEDKNKVSMMTIHSAKGLEFKNVFITGVEEGLFPSNYTIATPHELEEERRLFYVALTRAEKYLFISFAKQRFRWGEIKFCMPSRFISDIDEKYLDMPDMLENENSANDDLKIFYTGQDKKVEKSAKKHATSDFPPAHLTQLSKIQDLKSKINDTEFVDVSKQIKSGMRVEHQRFGYGTVVELEGTFPNIKATISFDNAGEKNLLLKFAKLKILK